jgi:DNA-directed RNA polymerase delta subunit
MAKKGKIKLEYRKGEDLYKINAQDSHIKKYQPEFLNIVNKHGHGNDADIVGLVSQVIKDYRKTTVTPTLKGWEDYHGKLTNIKGIEAGVEKNWAQFEKMKKAINAIDKDIVRYWLKNLVYNKTFAGLQAQDMLLKDIANRLTEEKGKTYSYINGDADDERAQIDGYIKAPDGKMCGLQIKSDSYRSHNTVEGNAPVPYVYYELKEDGLYYNFDINKLKFVDRTKYDQIKAKAKKKHEEKLQKEKEKKRLKIEREKRKEERIRKKAEKAKEKEAKVKIKAEKKNQKKY